ncbi:MAG: radical SAM protein [Fibrobacter sp.]|nr:radical SAM protein [Fibrobacter sp.]
MKYKHIFGPVRSRRLGVSLGIDMVQGKTCSLDCVYCECGETTDLTIERKEYVSFSELSNEIADYLSGNPKLDYVTFGGSGEPTLNTAFGPLIRFIKDNFPHYKTALLTNGTLFYLPEVREAAKPFDLILPSLDAISDKAFSAVNRPHKELSNQRIIEGLVTFCREFKGTIWIEVFIVPGVNDDPSELQAFKESLLRMNPSRVQLNSLDRPGPCSWVRTADFEQLSKISDFLAPLPVEIVSRKSLETFKNEKADDTTEETILSLLKRRPSTIEELSGISGVALSQLSVILENMVSESLVTAYTVNDCMFYRAM